jgi:preprotein translocase subunit SecY
MSRLTVMRLSKGLTAVVALLTLDIGARLGIPGVDREVLGRFTSGSRGGLLGLYEMIGGGGLSRAGVLALGMMPYLSARTFMWLGRIVSPGLEQMAHSIEGRHRTRVLTRWLTLALSLIQGFGFARFVSSIPGAVDSPGPMFMARTVLLLTAGSLVAMWFGERLTERDEDDLQSSTVLRARPEVGPTLVEPGQPASQPLRPRPSTDAEILRTRR